MTRRVLLSVLGVTMMSTPAAAQFASDFPGVPRASIPISGGKQQRIAWTLSGYKVPNAAATGDTVAGGVRLGFGQSYRIRSQFEIGYDVTLADGLLVQPPSGTTSTGAAVSRDMYMRGLTAYGLRIGAKFRPVSALDPDGNGYELAVGGAFQPQLKALYGYEKVGDSTRSGGQFDSKSVQTSNTFRQNPFASLSTATIVAAMGSFRSRRLSGDAALVSETVPDRTGDPSPVGKFDGISARVGGSFRLTPRIAVGGSYWGSGSPPWWDQVQFGAPGQPKAEEYGLLLQFGRDPESGIDFMVTSPTGNYGQSARLYIRSRSTH